MLACGLYRTVKPVGEIPNGRLVYFHNHGTPGPGVYFPERWIHNRATFSPKGTTLPAEFDTHALIALPPEGFYRVASAFFCCEKQCKRFEPEAFVQLGYNHAGQALLFEPELTSSGLHIPGRGRFIDDENFSQLVRLSLLEHKEQREQEPAARGIVIH